MSETLIRLYRNFFFRKILRVAVTVFIVSTLTFFIVRLMPGNPIDIYISSLMSTQGMSYQEARQMALAMFSIDLDAPLHLQYIQYLSNLIRGDLGVSITSTGTPVAKMIAEFLPWTLFSVSLSLFASFGIGVALGMVMAYRRGGIFDTILTGICTIMSAIPNYIVGILVIVFIGIQWNLYPLETMRGTYTSTITPGFTIEFIVDVFKHVLWPFITYVVCTFGGWALSMRANTISTLGEDYITVAKAKGLKESRITFSYVGRNAILPLFTSLTISFGFIFGGSLLIENIFVYKGIGWLLWSAINERDYPTMQGVFLIMTTAVVLSVTIADVLYGLIDPRVRRGE
ncbi:ABC transporter permease [Candidatus Bathyarchaeota archaeon]|nr:MAG: ABC transporter permease [Candidatus Bathyarchaeota archaeon]